VHARLVPIRPVCDAWLVSGSMRAYRKSDAAQVAQVALELATRLPELVYRNPGKIEQAWQQMQADRSVFVEFFGRDELVLPPARGRGTDQRLLPAPAGSRARRAARRPPAIPGMGVPAFQFPPELADAAMIGVIYDETDGLSFYNEYGMLRELFADPALASSKRYAEVLRGYLRAETICPLPLRRLAAASAKALVLRARAPSRYRRDRRPPQRAHRPVNPRRSDGRTSAPGG
jgi:hypothetical protein